MVNKSRPFIIIESFLSVYLTIQENIVRMKKIKGGRYYETRIDTYYHDDAKHRLRLIPLIVLG